MCGIIGIMSEGADTLAKTIESLNRLAYRGYDSAGVAMYDAKTITL